MTYRENLEVAQTKLIQILEENIELKKQLGQISSWEKTCEPEKKQVRKNTKGKLIPFKRKNGESR